MFEANAGYILRTQDSVQDTVYVLHLEGSDVYYSTEAVLGLSSAQALIMERPEPAETRVHPLNATASVGSVSLQLLDQSGAVTAVRQAAQVLGQSAVLYIGYRGLRWGEYVSIFPGIVTTFERTSSGLVWNVEVKDRFDKLDQEVFSSDKLAAEPWMDGDRSWDGGSLIIEDTNDDEVYDRVIVGGTDGEDPVTLLLKMLLSDGSQDGSQEGYNVWPAWAGLGLTTDDVDVAWCEAERDKILVVPFRFYYSRGVTVKRFLEEEICKALGGYPLISGTGRIRVHYPSRPVSTAGLPTLTRDHIRGKPTLRDSTDYHITHIVYELGDVGEGPTVRLQRASPQYLDGRYAARPPHEITSAGQQVDLGGVSIADAVMDALFARWGDPPPRVKMATHFSQHRIEAGEAVLMEHEHYPDWDGRGAGSTRQLEVLMAKPAVSKVDLECLDLTPALDVGTPAIIAPDTAPDWTSATAEDKAYAYLSDDSSETMSDGSRSYIWG